MALMEMPTYAGGGGGTLTHIEDVASIRQNAYAFTSIGKYIVFSSYESSNQTYPTISNYSVNGCAIDTDNSNIYHTTVTVSSVSYTVTNAVIIVDVTTVGATIQCNFATSAQATQVYKIG